MTAIKCADKDCEETYDNHRWGKIKAHAHGWYFPKEGDATCPQHNPPWVEEWRKKEEKDGEQVQDDV